MAVRAGVSGASGAASGSPVSAASFPRRLGTPGSHRGAMMAARRPAADPAGTSPAASAGAASWSAAVPAAWGSWSRMSGTAVSSGTPLASPSAPSPGAARRAWSRRSAASSARVSPDSPRAAKYRGSSSHRCRSASMSSVSFRQEPAGEAMMSMTPFPGVRSSKLAMPANRVRSPTRNGSAAQLPSSSSMATADLAMTTSAKWLRPAVSCAAIRSATIRRTRRDRSPAWPGRSPRSTYRNWRKSPSAGDIMIRRPASLVTLAISPFCLA